MAPPLIVDGNRADAVGGFGRFGHGLSLLKELGELSRLTIHFLDEMAV